MTTDMSPTEIVEGAASEAAPRRPAGRPASGRRRHRVVGGTLAVAAVGAAVAVATLAGSGSGTDVATEQGPAPAAVAAGPEIENALVSTGRGLVVPGQEAVALQTPGRQLQASTAAIAATLPDGRIVYGSWEELVDIERERSPEEQGIVAGTPIGRPSVRVVDPASGEDELVADGASAFAVRRDGALGLVVGTVPERRYAFPYEGDIMVRTDGGEERWSEAPGPYALFGWAGDTLVATIEGPEGAPPSLGLLDGPGPMRTVLPAVTPLAVDPSGGRLLVATQTDGAFGVRVLDVRSGQLEDTAVAGLAGGLGPVLTAVWTADGIVATAATAEGVPLIMRLEVGDGSIAVRSTLEVPAGEVYVPFALSVGDDVTRVEAIASPITDRAPSLEDPPAYVLISCDETSCSTEDLPDPITDQIGFVTDAGGPAQPG